MTPAQWLFAVEKHRPEGASNYFCVVRDGDSFTKAPDLQAALGSDAKGGTLYAFCEPTLAEIDLALAAGIKRIYCCLSARDGYRLRLMSSVSYPVPTSHPLKPVKVQWVRTKVLNRWAGSPVCRMPSPTHWLVAVAKRAVERHSNYFCTVRDGKSLAEAHDLPAALTKAEGGTLYAFCEPTPAEIGLAETAGIKEIFYGISKHDGRKLGVYRERLQPRRVQRAREVILKEWVPKW